jgi:cobalt-zinc-cadmium efflux system outer membrane protein
MRRRARGLAELNIPPAAFDYALAMRIAIRGRPSSVACARRQNLSLTDRSMNHSQGQIICDSALGDARHHYVRPYTIALTLALVATAISAQSQSPQPPPLTLHAVLDSVAARYPLVLAAQAQLRAARGSRVTAGAFGNPIVSYQDDRPSTGSASIPGIDRERTTTVTLPLEPLYQRGSRVQRADAKVRAATEDVVASRRRAELDATRAFYRTALAQVGVATARDLLVWLDSLVAYNRSRAQQGVAAEADLIRSQLERDRAAADATIEDAVLAQARAELSTFVGVAPATAGLLSIAADERPLMLPQGVASPASPPSMLGVTGGATLQSQALTGRAEVRAARERVAAASAGVSSEYSMIFRQLGATFGTKQIAGATSIIAGFNLPIPLFDPNRGEIARASAERDAAAYELAAQERSVSAEVSGAYEAARLLTERATAMASDTSGFLARADDARRIALGAFREGAIPLFQVIDAARAWGEARLSYYRLLYAQHQGVAALVFAEGGELLTTLPALTTPVTPNH